jgi:glycosyltransferase involved in cell wall biosynthesis
LPEASRPLYLHVGIEEPGEPERRLAEELGIADSVRFLGQVLDLRPVYAAADLFAMPSLYEGFSVAALEALASGLPSLFADVGGLRDLREFYPGLTYAEPTAESIATALETLVTEPTAERLARSATYPALSRSLFGLEVGVGRYVSLYRDAYSAG